ncbi:molybdopterin-dependent oxidoreductase [Streptomyces genisteinicus]|uniref:Molybdopterin-dependent oxidoreductase n=1 Tax=Streptomyces genisteinicus TaxID=2768068 RepID=A0A7H0I093_9ACTN|nr:molybdopterin-dependent oxidoreductase [Streptomyces genisteinicus]QNP66209.1 molybdopterin-dependent oxidoreductase [Streptomyces genisteinicus]
MGSLSPGFQGRTHAFEGRLPPGQYPTESFPVLSAGPTPQIPTDRWSFTVTTELGETRTWSWEQMMALPQEEPTADIHCVTRWSKFDTRWRGVSLDVFLDEVETAADFVVAESFDGYTANLPLEDVTGGKAWLAHTYDGWELAPDHGGPARLVIPHLYFWKSAKWVKGLILTPENEPGFWESAGYHDYGDPWREQRYWSD